MIIIANERLDSESVSAEKEPPPGFIPDGDGEHAVDLTERIDPLVFIEVQYHLGVSPGAKAMAPSDELPPQGLVVVNFSVEDNPDAPILVGHGLSAVRREVDYAQAPVA
jgi:hypothetical protein